MNTNPHLPPIPSINPAELWHICFNAISNRRAQRLLQRQQLAGIIQLVVDQERQILFMVMSPSL